VVGVAVNAGLDVGGGVVDALEAVNPVQPVKPRDSNSAAAVRATSRTLPLILAGRPRMASVVISDSLDCRGTTGNWPGEQRRYRDT
jgi:hypothetical protein